LNLLIISPRIAIRGLFDYFQMIPVFIWIYKMPKRSWFHVILTYYGNWLPGDPRGFRTRHHKTHVEGDYKNPPPKGLYEGLYQSSQDSLKQPRVVLSAQEQMVVGNAFLETFNMCVVPVLAIAVHSTHLHLQGEFESARVRILCGKAKRNAWFRLCELGLNLKLWAKRGKYQHIKDYQHHKNTHAYILKHADENAWVWRWSKKGGTIVHIPS
jgi:hypothetical protein